MNKNQLSTTEFTHWIGVDVAKKTFDAALVRYGQRWPATSLVDLPACTFERTPEGTAEFITWLDTLTQEDTTSIAVRVVMEATGRYSTELAAWIVDHRPELEPAIAPPHQTASFIKSMGLRSKTDRMEAKALGFYGIERNPKPYQPQSKEEMLLRDLVRYRKFLVRQRVAEGNRNKELGNSPITTKISSRRLEQTQKDIDKTESEMQKIVNNTSEIKSDIELLCSIYGVGFIVAVTIRAELGDLRQFQKARQLSAFAGLTPARRQSGTSINGRAHMDKKGNPLVRQALYLSAMVVIRGKNTLQQDYCRLREQGKSPMSAIGAIMRKLLVLMRAILISGKPYDPLWKTRSKEACAQ